MSRSFPFSTDETTSQCVCRHQVHESKVCGSGLAMQVDAIVGDLTSIGTPTEEIAQFLFGRGLSWEEIKPGFVSFGLSF